MNGVCQTCRWWEFHVTNEGFCHLSSFYIPWMERSWKVKARDMGIADSRPKVWTKREEVRTSPGFGCNQWEAKP